MGRGRTLPSSVPVPVGPRHAHHLCISETLAFTANGSILPSTSRQRSSPLFALLLGRPHPPNRARAESGAVSGSLTFRRSRLVLTERLAVSTNSTEGSAQGSEESEEETSDRRVRKSGSWVRRVGADSNIFVFQAGEQRRSPSPAAPILTPVSATCKWLRVLFFHP